MKRQQQMFSVAKAKRQLQLRQGEIDLHSEKYQPLLVGQNMSEFFVNWENQLPTERR